SRFVIPSMVGILSITFLVPNNPSPLRALRYAEAAKSRGGMPSACALTPINLATGCVGRIVTIQGIQYKCSGTNLDQGCPVSQTNNNNVCNTGQATCSGEEYANNGNGIWLDVGTCKDVQYTTARLQSGGCQVPP